jgi:hypothetical protein
MSLSFMATLSLVMAAGSAALAGPFQDELGSDPNLLAGDVKLSLMNGDDDGAESGKGTVPYLKATGGPPKRVALLSFYVYDCGNHKEKSCRM